MSDPGVVAVVGSLGGAAIGGAISYAIAHNGNKSAKDLAELRQEHESTESGKARDHEARLEHYKLRRAAKERVYPEVVKIISPRRTPPPLPTTSKRSSGSATARRRSRRRTCSTPAPTCPA